jgi:hypothetical protein
MIYHGKIHQPWINGISFISTNQWYKSGGQKQTNFRRLRQMRIYSVELAIQELDDKRMLRLRQEVEGKI